MLPGVEFTAAVYRNGLVSLALAMIYLYANGTLGIKHQSIDLLHVTSLSLSPPSPPPLFKSFLDISISC